MIIWIKSSICGKEGSSKSPMQFYYVAIISHWKEGVALVMNRLDVLHLRMLNAISGLYLLSCSGEDVF